MRILGIDPGTRIAGYGLVDLYDDGRVSGLAAGVWRFDAELPLAARLASLAVELVRVIELYKPQAVCVEQAFVAQNIRSALFLGHARGVVLAHSHQNGLEVFELAPTAVKKAVLAHGRSSKDAIAQALSSLLGVSFAGLPHDASDALGIAYAHALRERIARARGQTVNDMVLEEKKKSVDKKRAGGTRWATVETDSRNQRTGKVGFERFLQTAGIKK
jgi:crossover junction endodeoxyribonuclease RuvC